jgi:hypothetical protein
MKNDDDLKLFRKKMEQAEYYFTFLGGLLLLLLVYLQTLWNNEINLPQ